MNVNPTYPLQHQTQQAAHPFGGSSSRAPFPFHQQTPQQFFPTPGPFPPNSQQYQQHTTPPQSQVHQQFQQKQAGYIDVHGHGNNESLAASSSTSQSEYRHLGRPFSWLPHGVTSTNPCHAKARLCDLSDKSLTKSAVSAEHPNYTSAASSSLPSLLSQIGSTAHPLTSAQQTPSMAALAAPLSSGNMMQRAANNASSVVQPAQIHHGNQVQNLPQQSAPALYPQSAARERARVTLLLEINGRLLQEVIALQLQGKAGTPSSQIQQSPVQDSTATSPTSATEPSSALNNSPVDTTNPGSSKAPSQEYIECMRRLQANLAYLAAIADAKKKASGSLPTGPAIMAPPPHLASMEELYKKLNALFPDAGRSNLNKAMALASAQSVNALGMAQGHG